MQDEMPDERTASSVYGEERLPSYTSGPASRSGRDLPLIPAACPCLGRPGWCAGRLTAARRGGTSTSTPRKDGALHPIHVLKDVLGDDGVQLAAAFRETRGDSLK